MADQAARHGRPAEAVTLIDTAAVGVRGRETPRLLAELYIRKAYALAILQDASACTTAVSKARTQVEEFEPEPDNDPLWLYWVSPAELAGEFSRQPEPGVGPGIEESEPAVHDVQDRLLALVARA